MPPLLVCCWFAIFLVMLFLLRLIARLPLPVLHVLGRCAGRLIYALPGRYRQRLRANAAQAGYPTPAFARHTAGEAGAMLAETPRVWFQNAASLAQVTSEAEAMLEAARAEGRGILYLTPHLGSFEIIARHLARSAPLTVMFRPPRSQMLAGIMSAARNTSGVTAVPASLQGVRAFVRALRRGQAVGMLPDQVPRTGDGVWAAFFGRMAYTATLPCRLAQQTNAIIILIAAERLSRGRGWRIHAVRAPELPKDALNKSRGQALLSDRDGLQAAFINRAMEMLIQRFPEQYLWSYNRYKTPRGAPPAPPLTTGAPL